MRSFIPLLFCLSSSSWALEREEITRLHHLISDWRVQEARRSLRPLLEEQPNSPDLAYVEARLLFFEGRYGESLKRFDALITPLDTLPESLRQERQIVASTQARLKGFDEQFSEDGRFLIRYTGRDVLLIPYLLEVLQAADVALAQDFELKPEGIVLVELYPRAEYLAAVSPLTEKDLETSGTIALCKYNRLMFTSPRGLVRGYSWRDTISHEFVHYYINKLAGNRGVPIWLHEGIARYQESRWRATPGFYIDPPQEDLLARSLQAKKLISFQEMHPSLAKLPSQEAASLAYAQVHTVVDLFMRWKGYPGLRAFLLKLRAGLEMNRALRESYDVDLSELWRLWLEDLSAQGLKTYPGLKQISLKFKRPGMSEEEASEGDFSTIEEKQIKDLAHLGELLRARERDKGALMEYRKAALLGGEGHPLIQNGIAASLLKLKQVEEIPTVLKRVRLYYPGFFNTHLHLGEAYLKLGRSAEALQAFEEAVGINPFHPRPHQALTQLYRLAGQAAKATRAEQTLEILR